MKHIHISTIPLIWRITLIVFIVEIAIMLVYSTSPDNIILWLNQNPVLFALIEATILTLISSPIIYFWIIHPFVLEKYNQNDEKEKRTAELVIANEELAFQNDEKEKRAAELVIATDQLVSQSRHVVMGEMITMLTHQWKQPLTAMMLVVGVIKKKHSVIEMSDNDAEFLNTRIKKVEAMMVDQNQLLTDFREFFHPDKKKNLFNIRANIDSVLDMLKGFIVKNSITLKVDIPKALEILGYDRELRHVMINLIKNAMDQLVEKTVKDSTIWIKAAVNDELLTITVEDNGGGVDESVIKTIFEPYVSTKSLNGTGLGLYMSKAIIQDNFKGSLEVINTEKGAKFTITVKK
jgi:C4-dicarboxylate-specific signal transduction histidine kinase